MSELTLQQKLLKIQQELKAPKSNFNSFGNFNYRSLEDILEAVKPINDKYGITLTLTDRPVQVGDRYYIEATALITDNNQEFKVTAYAREPQSKTKMDDAQVTGTSSSYARKYALHGLYLIDDTKDADTDEFQQQTRNNSQLNQQIIDLFEQALKKLNINNDELHKKLGTNKTKLNNLVKSDDIEAKEKLIKKLEEVTNGTE